MHHELAVPEVSIGHVHGVDQVKDRVVDDRGDLGCGVCSRDAGAGGGDDAVRLAGTSAHGEVGVLDTAKAGHDALANEGFDIDVRILQEFERHRHDLGRILVDRQRHHAEDHVSSRRGGILADQFADFSRTVRGRVVDLVAHRRLDDGGNRAHAAVPLEGVEHLVGDRGLDGETTFRARGRRHGVLNAPLFSGQCSVTAAHPLGEHLRLGRLLVVADALGSLDHGVVEGVLGDPLVVVVDVLDLSVEGVDLSHAGVVDRLVNGRLPFLLVDQVVQRLRLDRALFAEVLNAHGKLLF